MCASSMMLLQVISPQPYVWRSINHACMLNDAVTPQSSEPNRMCLLLGLGHDRCGNLIGNPGTGKGTGRSHGYSTVGTIVQRTWLWFLTKQTFFDCNGLKCIDYHRISQSINSHTYTCTTKRQFPVLRTYVPTYLRTYLHTYIRTS